MTYSNQREHMQLLQIKVLLGEIGVRNSVSDMQRAPYTPPAARTRSSYPTNV